MLCDIIVINSRPQTMISHSYHDITITYIYIIYIYKLDFSYCQIMPSFGKPSLMWSYSLPMAIIISIIIRVYSHAYMHQTGLLDQVYTVFVRTCVYICVRDLDFITNSCKLLILGSNSVMAIAFDMMLCQL